MCLFVSTHSHALSGAFLGFCRTHFLPSSTLAGTIESEGIDRLISPIDRLISPIDRLISPKIDGKCVCATSEFWALGVAF